MSNRANVEVLWEAAGGPRDGGQSSAAREASEGREGDVQTSAVWAAARNHARDGQSRSVWEASRDCEQEGHESAVWAASCNCEQEGHGSAVWAAASSTKEAAGAVFGSAPPVADAERSEREGGMHAEELAALRALVLAEARRVLPGCGIPVGEGLADEQAMLREPGGERILASMQFRGKLEGQLSLLLPLGVARRAYPLVLPEEQCAKAALLDWAAETVNRVLAAIKNRLATSGIELDSAAPSARVCEHPSADLPAGGGIFSAGFSSGGECVGMWMVAVAVEDLPSLCLGPGRGRGDEAGSAVLFEGDAVLF